MKKPISLAYALSWICYCKCPICHSGIQGKEYMITNINDWKKNVAPLINYNGSVRLTLTGGEPMYFWNETDELLEFIKYLHENKIHICLNTTGINITEDKLETLDKYIDTILLSVRGLTVDEVIKEFGIDKKQAKELRNTQLMILNEIHKTNIRLEVSTVVTNKNNYSDIKDLAAKLHAINNNIIWRVEEYYRIGKQTNQPIDEYDLGAAQYDTLMIDLYKEYSSKINIRHSSKESRKNAPDPFLFPDGSLHTTSRHSYMSLGQIDKYNFSEMATRRDWDSYKKSLRDWGWDRDI